MNNKLISFLILSALVSLGVKTTARAAPVESTNPFESKSHPLDPQVPQVEIEPRVVDLTAPSGGHAGLRSLVVPGWGQIFNGEKRKGAVLFGTTLTAGFLAYFFYQESSESYDEYKNSGRINDSRYDDYERELTVSRARGGMAAILWVYSIYDAFGKGSSPKTSRSAALQVDVNPAGGKVTWQKKF